LHSLLYKVLTIQEWEVASQSGRICTQLDAADGFIHLSSASQLNMTLSLYFSQEESVVLLRFNEADIKDGLKYEYSEKRNGQFAHFYGKLSIKNISQSWHLDRSAFGLSEEVMLEAEQK
jgi:uncharacterized protein (DUF952 family)|tara:strand:+ start:394 stop:750 length:357 start_codon:yes stop_codon:yes gene_type:complete